MSVRPAALEAATAVAGCVVDLHTKCVLTRGRECGVRRRTAGLLVDDRLRLVECHVAGPAILAPRHGRRLGTFPRLWWPNAIVVDPDGERQRARHICRIRPADGGRWPLVLFAFRV